MLKIAHRSTSALRVVYALAGEITAEQLPRLEALVCASLKAGRKLILDVERVWRVDRNAVSFFTDGSGSGVRLVGLPKGLRERLRGEWREDAWGSAT